MRDRELYETILGLQRPWTVERVEVSLEGGAVHVWLAREEGAPVECPTCGTARPIYDHRDASCQAALSAAEQNLQVAAAASAEGTGKTGRKLKALAHKVTLGLRHAERAHPKRQAKAFRKVTAELQRLRDATAQATGKVSATTLEALQAAIDAFLGILPS